MTDEWLREVVGRASTVHERFENPDAYPGSSPDPERVDTRLHAWRERVAGGDSDRFEQRLRFDGIDPCRLRYLLGEVDLAPDRGLPEWATLLSAVSRRMAESPSRAPQLEEDPIAFEEVLADFADEARARLGRPESARTPGPITDAGHAHLRRNLLLTLGWLAGQSLALEFRVFRDSRESRLERVVRKSRGLRSDRHYRAFVDMLRRDGLRELSREYSSLARLLAHVTLMWVETTRELRARLAADLPHIRDELLGGRDPGRVSTVVTGVSDRHRGGRSVAILGFESGARVVYKPRGHGLERAWARFADRLDAMAPPTRVRVPSMIEREGYAWVEHIAPAEVDDAADVAEYYRQVGGLLAVLHLFAATDCHYENLVAEGSQPVLVDAETLVHGSLRRELPEGFGALLAAHRRFDQSILRPGLLPRWSAEGDGSSDDSGLVAELPGISRRAFATYDDLRSDDLEVRARRIALPQPSNVPMRGGRRTSVLRHQDRFVAGVEQMLGFLSRHRAHLRASLDELSGSRSRFVFRATAVYAELLEGANHPDLMRSGVDRSIHFDALARQRAIRSTPPRWWPLIATERRALASLDVPQFSADAEETVVKGDPHDVGADIVDCPGLTVARQRLDGLDDREIELQLSWVRRSLYSHDIDRERLTEFADAPVDPASHEMTERTNTALVAEAGRLGALLHAQAIRGHDGSATWIGFAHHIGSSRFRLQSVSPDLYGGSVGISLYFAALYAQTGDAGWRDLARAGLSHVLADAQRGWTERVVTPAHGAVAGVGALSYGLCTIADHTGDEEYLNAARAAADLITSELVTRDRVFDVCHGVAGTIVGLLPLWRRQGDERVLQTAIECGDHLLASREEDPRTRTRGWTTIEPHPLTGMSHGSAGIAMALSRLAGATGHRRFAQGAEEALNFERAVYSDVHRNWPDFRGEHGRDRHTCMTSWCHGAPGIGLARAGSSSASPDELRVAMSATRGVGLSDCDNLCCGNFGRAEALLTMARATEDAGAERAARRLASASIGHADVRGGYGLLPGVPRGVLDPGFFQGISGIAYTCLRLAAPERFASVLQWQDLRD